MNRKKDLQDQILFYIHVFQGLLVINIRGPKSVFYIHVFREIFFGRAKKYLAENVNMKNTLHMVYVSDDSPLVSVSVTRTRNVCALHEESLFSRFPSGGTDIFPLLPPASWRSDLI